MKSNSLLIATGLVLILITGCKSKTADEFIVNKWHLYDMSGKDSESIPDSVKAKMYKEASIEFKKDGKYETNAMGEGSRKGTYRFSADKKILITIEDGGMPDSVSVIELSATKMTVKDKNADVKISFKPH